MNLYKNVRKLGLLCGILFLSAGAAQASLLIEPHLGFNVHGGGDVGATEYDYNGAQLGLRLGYQNLGFMGGLDLTHSNFDLEGETNGVKTTSEMSRNEWGVFVGYNLPILLRAWGAYYFSNTTKNDATSAEYSGNTKELGIGFTGLPFLSLNLMYRMVTYDELKVGSVKTDPDMDFKEIVLGVSLPFTL